MVATQSDTDNLFELLTEMGAKDCPHIGRLVAINPLAQDEDFNFTFPKGQGSNLYAALMSWFGNKGYDIKKIWETLDISPVDQGYYGLTQRQKDELEGKIKQGLASVSQSIADFELLNHDFRKYKEFLKMIETNDEHSLRAVFVDEVDISTGANSIKQMIARWPTMISDFMKLGDSNNGNLSDVVDVDKIKDGLEISRAEAVILSTKQRLYLNWKNDFFGREVRERCERIQGLINSRKKSIDEYRNWLKPTIAKFKMYDEGLSSESGRLSQRFSEMLSPGQAVSSNDIETWAWQPMIGIVGRTGTIEHDKGKSGTEFVVEPYDEFTKNEIILKEETKYGGKTFKGLKGIHKWITEDWVNKTVKKVKKDLDKDQLYYVLMRLKYNRAVIRMPDGAEMEDVTYDTQMKMLSQNALMVMLLHQKALEKEFEDYIDEILGLSSGGSSTNAQIEELIKSWKEDEEKKKKKDKSISNPINWKEIKTRSEKVWRPVNKMFGFNFVFSRLGPYEHNFADRIATPYLSTIGGDMYAVFTGYLKDGAGVGK